LHKTVSKLGEAKSNEICLHDTIQIISKQFNSGKVAHTTNMRDHKRQTGTVTNMTVEDIKADKHSKNTVKVDRHKTLH